ncbi:MAG: GntR family transcriptional regulator [Rhodobacteraceae bacterium]|jgi:DNA-binding GntR family transcriptional regulator|nr:GntR family transcriptional regulator [Paracoccaceae bacterium]
MVTDAAAPLMIDHPPLGHDLARVLAAGIIRGRPAPGTRLVETEISARHGVSRSPLREALGRLEVWGLAERRPRYGVRVAPMSVANLDDLSICRIPLEARAAALVAAQPDRVAVAGQLADRHAAMQAAFARGDAEACFAANLQMMDILHDANPNPVLARLLAQLNMPAQRYRYLAYRAAGATLGMLVGANAALITTIRAGDAPRAEAVTTQMVTDAWQDLRVRLPGLMAATWGRGRA